MTTITTIATTGNSIAVPAGAGLEVVRNKNGKMTGTRLSFIGAKSAKELKEEGKAAGLEGKKLKEYVNAALRGASDAAWIRHDAIVSGMRNAGAVPADLKGNNAGDVFKVEYRFPGKAEQTLAEQLVAKGKFATVEEAEAFLA